MASEGQERRLAAILSADAVGYARLMAEDEQGTIRTLTDYREEIAMLVRQHRGRVEDSPGDNVLAEFPTALDAVHSAVEIQRSLRVRNTDLPAERRMEFRIGIHMGDVAAEGERVYGDGVNIAARLEGLAEPGGICISGEIHGQVESKLDLRFEDLGEQSVKNIPKPIRVFRVQVEPETAPIEARPRSLRRAALTVTAVVLLAAVAVAGWRMFGDRLAQPIAAAVSAPIRSIAVLPLGNLSGDPEQEYLADGMTEALIASLAQIGPELRVVSRTSVMQYKDARKTIRKIASELDVDGVIEGSAIREGDRIRITVQLIDSRRDAHLWAETYERSFSSALALQGEIAGVVSEQLRVALSPERERLLATPRPVDPEALDLYLRGSHHLTWLTVPDARRAVELFEASIAADPSFARSHEGLAQAYWSLMWNLFSVSPDEAFPRVRAAASRAIELDDRLARAHMMLANVRLRTEWDWAGAEAAFRRALEIDPTASEVLSGFAYLLSAAGRHAEAIELAERALTADPVNLHTRMDYAYILFAARRIADAIEEAGRILEIDREFAKAYDVLGACYSVLKDREAAYRAYDQNFRLMGHPPWYIEAWHRGYEEAGWSGASRALRGAIRERSGASSSAFTRAIMACRAGEPEAALVELEDAPPLDPLILLIGTWPDLDCVRDHPRFQDLLRTINWPGLDS